MGLLNGAYGPGMGRPQAPQFGQPGGGMGQMMPPQMPQAGGGGLAQAFSGNPQFQAQLQAMLQQQSPGFQGAQMTPPQPAGGAPGSGMPAQGLPNQGGMPSGLAGLGMMGANPSFGMSMLDPSVMQRFSGKRF